MSARSRNLLLSSALMVVALIGMSHYHSQGKIPRHLSLDHFPLHIGDWTGSRIQLDQKTKTILNADSYASIIFTGQPGQPGIFFFSVYYDHQTPEKNIHSPENCLPGSGWAILSSKTISLPLRGNGLPPVEVKYNVIQKELDKQLVLYWYQERGNFFANEYMGRFYLIRDALRLHRTDGALVRVSMPITGSLKETLLLETRFLQSTMTILSTYIPGKSTPDLFANGPPKTLASEGAGP
ncbi:MAG: exosortase C-terminal domain/associated protein EpsI [Leptospirales bacterium]